MRATGAKPRRERSRRILRRARSDMKMSKPGFASGQRFLFFAEGEADLRSAVLRMVIEAGAGDAGDANVLDEIFCEGDVARRRGIFRFIPMKTGNVGHDVVGATWFVDGEPGIFKDSEQASAFFGVRGGEIVVIGLRKLQREGTSLLKRSGGAHG